MGIGIRRSGLSKSLPSVGTPRLIVSLHDVAPPFEADIRDQIESLRRIGLQRISLKVVPNWHGRHPISASPFFVEMLTEAVDRGAHVVLHGYEHCPRGPWRGSPIRLARARLFSYSAAEFMTMSGAEARKSIEEGTAECIRAGLPRPDTFCAPGWLMTDECEDAVAESGIRYVAGMHSVLDLPERRLHWTPSVGYMGGSGLHDAGAYAFGLLAAMALPNVMARKIYLHPDPSGRRRWTGAVARIAMLLAAGVEPLTLPEVARPSVAPRQTGP